MRSLGDQLNDWGCRPKSECGGFGLGFRALRAVLDSFLHIAYYSSWIIVSEELYPEPTSKVWKVFVSNSRGATYQKSGLGPNRRQWTLPSAAYRSSRRSCQAAQGVHVGSSYKTPQSEGGFLTEMLSFVVICLLKGFLTKIDFYLSFRN